MSDKRPWSDKRGTESVEEMLRRLPKNRGISAETDEQLRRRSEQFARASAALEKRRRERLGRGQRPETGDRDR